MLCRRQLFSLLVVLLIHLTRADECKDTKPDFSAPGRRISEQKCREFNWERKRLDKCSNELANTKYPYMGAIGYKNENESQWSILCSGFLISDKFVVTAAHCIRTPPYISPPDIVRLGHENAEDGVPRLDVKIRSKIIHPQYKPPIKYYDIGLIELESAVPFSKSVYPACLWSKAALDVVDVGSPAWGRESHRGPIRKVIAEMNVKLLDQNTCLEAAEPLYTRLFKQVQDHHVCVNESVSPIVSCQGGAPLVTKVALDGNSEDQMPYAVAVSSFGRMCGTIAVSVRTSSFIDWIEQIVWPDQTSL